ncbi:hypothetical protein ACQP2F_05515 [Actinoplanes sp. CA-030573]|uniref:hypothetical protein n=1 Tax=Actinoplanes sp. CA-030573 TaxID=3239898 RepID=UPI003D8D3111
MTEQRAEHHSGGWHLQTSKLLVIAFVVAVAATGALIVTVLTQMPSGMTPPPPAPGAMPPPPPNLRPLAVFSVVTGFFVLSWLAVLVIAARDQILRQLRRQGRGPTPGLSADELGARLEAFRAELASDRENELRTLSERMTELTSEYGERRETDGYLSGMRTATSNESPPQANVRAFRRTPPPR